MSLSIDVEQEVDGRWIAEIPALPGVMAYGTSRQEAIAHTQALALPLSPTGSITVSRRRAR